MSWDTDLLSELVRDEFDVPLTEEEIKTKSDKAKFSQPDDADDAEEAE